MARPNKPYFHPARRRWRIRIAGVEHWAPRTLGPRDLGKAWVWARPLLESAAATALNTARDLPLPGPRAPDGVRLTERERLLVEIARMLGVETAIARVLRVPDRPDPEGPRASINGRAGRGPVEPAPNPGPPPPGEDA